MSASCLFICNTVARTSKSMTLVKSRTCFGPRRSRVRSWFVFHVHGLETFLTLRFQASAADTKAYFDSYVKFARLLNESHDLLIQFRLHPGASANLPFSPLACSFGCCAYQAKPFLSTTAACCTAGPRSRSLREAVAIFRVRTSTSMSSAASLPISRSSITTPSRRPMLAIAIIPAIEPNSFKACFSTRAFITYPMCFAYRGSLCFAIQWTMPRHVRGFICQLSQIQNRTGRIIYKRLHGGIDVVEALVAARWPDKRSQAEPERQTGHKQKQVRHCTELLRG